MVTRKNIRTQIAASNRRISSELEGGPPNGINECATLQPVRDRLLANGRNLSVGSRVESEVLPELRRESDLVSGDLDGAFKRNNVVSLGHGQGKYTRKLVAVNKLSCLTPNKETCTVLTMPQVKRKPVPAPVKAGKTKRRTDPDVGPDGFTLAQRLHKLMTEMNVGQADLARMCWEYYATFHPGSDEPRVKQQHIFNILQGQESSWVLPLIAYVFDVNDMWLQFGIGQRDRRKN
ncbi:MAG TPA: hypothetical protein VGN16_19680 [Acidobacteriaceae bacterium]|jgi:hypothetical protein